MASGTCNTTEKYKPISKVVYAVPAYDHPCDAGNIPRSRVEVGVGVAVPMVRNLGRRSEESLEK